MSNKRNNEIIKGKTEDGKIVVSGQEIFKLIDTFGFPLDMAYEILNEHNMIFDMYEFIKCAMDSGNFSISKLRNLLSILPCYDEEMTMWILSTLVSS